MDLVFKAADGSWHVIDYKFSDEPESGLRKKYGLQLNLYRLAIRRFQKDSEPVIHSSLIVVGRGGVKTVEFSEDTACRAAAVKAAEELDTLLAGTSSTGR
jgi:hypothetical protein